MPTGIRRWSWLASLGCADLCQTGGTTTLSFRGVVGHRSIGAGVRLALAEEIARLAFAAAERLIFRRRVVAARHEPARYFSNCGRIRVEAGHLHQHVDGLVDNVDRVVVGTQGD